jgi:hypothetical protein
MKIQTSSSQGHNSILIKAAAHNIPVAVVAVTEEGKTF